MIKLAVLMRPIHSYMSTDDLYVMTIKARDPRQDECKHTKLCE